MSIGQTLRARREERGLTIEQAAFQSRVPLRLAQALESDDYSLLPDACYLVRLLHEYARFLSLDPAPLDGEFRRAIRRPPAASLALVPLVPSRPAIPWRHVLWSVAGILIVTPLVFIALSLGSKRAAERSAPPQPPPPAAEERATGEGQGLVATDRLLVGDPESTERDVLSAPDGLSVEPESTPGSVEQTQKGGPSAAVAADPSSPQFLLTARAVERTWMAVHSDGGQVRQVLLQKGETARFVAETGFVVTVGNAGGVNLTLNGEAVPPLGKSGQVIRDLAIPPLPKDRAHPAEGSSVPVSARPGRP